MSPYSQLVLDHEDGNDRMRVEFEPDRSVSEGDFGDLAARLGKRIHEALHVRLDIHPVAPDSLPRYDLKTKRIIDNRPKELRRKLDR